MSFWHGTPGPLLYAHRGASAECPENTVPAFRRALEHGADVLELDVHPTRDGVFVVSHDAHGTRSAGIARRIGDCTWAEVARWDAGHGFVDAAGARPFARQGIAPPRFDELLASFPGVPFNVDVKSASASALGRLVALVHEARAEERVLLTSFSAAVLRRLRELPYRGPIGLSQLDVVRLVFSPGFVSRWFPLGGTRAQIPTRSGGLDLSSPGFIAKCHALALDVDYWVVNDPEQALLLLARAADGIITDDPRAVSAAFREAPSAEAWRKRHPQLR